MPVGSLDKAIRIGKDTEEDVGHANNDTGEQTIYVYIISTFK